MKAQVKPLIKVLLMSLGGSVGKTMITTQCLFPHMPDATILCVDTANDSARDFGIKNVEMHKGDDFNTTYSSLMVSEKDVIVDVGGSKECQQFMEGMLAVDGSDEASMIIIPSRANSKDQGSAIKTIERLIAYGVDKNKIRVIFTDVKENAAQEMDYVVRGLEANGITPDFNLTIFHSELFDDMIKDHLLITNILADKTDYKALMIGKGPEEKKACVDALLRSRMAHNTVWPNLQAVYAALFPEVAK